MSAAVDVSKSDNLDFSQSLGRQSGPEVTSVFRAGIRAICSSGDETVVLQQLIYLSEVRGAAWVQASASYIGKPLSIPERTVGNCLDRLAAKGFIESEQRSPGEAKHHRVVAGPILEAMESAGFEADRDSLFGHPRQSGSPPSKDSQPPPSPNWRHKEQSKDKEEQEELEADGRASEDANEAVDELDEQTPTAPKNSTDRHIWEVFRTWGISGAEARRIRRTLDTLGLSDEMIRQYVSERAADFASRSRQIARSEVIRYTTARRDLADRGYIRPLVAVSEPPADPQPDEAEPTDDELDEPGLSSSDVTQRADRLMNKDPNMDRAEANTRAFNQLLEEQWEASEE